MTPTNTPAELRGIAAELAAQIRTELDAVRSELRQAESERNAAVLQRLDELVSTSQNLPERVEASLTGIHEAVVDLRDGLASGPARDIDGQVPSTATGEQLEAAISHLTAVAGSAGTLAEIEVVVETSMRELRSALSSLSERLDEIPVALRAELAGSLASVHGGVSQLRDSVEPKLEYLLVQAEGRAARDEELGAQFSDLRLGVEALATLEGSAGELRTEVASVSENVRSLEVAVYASSQRQASLAADLSTLTDEVARLARRLPARPKPVRLEDGQIEALAEAVVAAGPGPRTPRKSPSAGPAAGTPDVTAPAGKASTASTKKTVPAKTVARSRGVRTPRPAAATGSVKRTPVKTAPAKTGVKKVSAAPTTKTSGDARRAPSSPRRVEGGSTPPNGAPQS